MGLVVSVVFALGLAASPLFHIQIVEFHGLSMYSEDSLLHELNLHPDGSFHLGRSLAFAGTRNLARQLESLPYIRTATITRQLPRTLVIQIYERFPIATIFDSYLSLYVAVDGDGIVLEILGFPIYGLPVVTGMQLLNYSIGNELVSYGDTNLMPIFMRIADIFDRHGMTNLARLDISDINNMSLTVGNILIHIGSIDDADLKIMRAGNILDQGLLGANDRGTLFIYNLDNIYFSIGR